MLTVLGEALIDLVGDETFTYRALPGGSPMNVAVGLARLEHPTQFMARLSTDAFGRQLRAHIEGNGVLLDFAPRVTEPSTLAVVSLDDEGRAEYDFYVAGTADWQWSDDELRAMPTSQLFHTGSLASWTPPGAHRIVQLAQTLHSRGDTLTSYDPNIRPGLQRDPEAARAFVERSLACSHVVKCSEEDLNYLYPDDALEEVLMRWLDAGPLLAIVTRGGEGALARTPQLRLEREGMAIKLIDTIGAGDAFMAGLLSGLVDRNLATPAALADISKADLADVLDDATLVAGLTCEQQGAQPPTRAQFLDAGHRIGR